MEMYKILCFQRFRNKFTGIDTGFSQKKMNQFSIFVYFWRFFLADVRHILNI